MRDGLLHLDTISHLAALSADASPWSLERELNGLGFTFGLADPDDPTGPLADYIAGRRWLDSRLKREGLKDLVVSLSVKRPDGQTARTVLSPRSAAGPDLKALLFGHPGAASLLTQVLLRVRPIPEWGRTGRIEGLPLERAVSALAREAQAFNSPDLLAFSFPPSWSPTIGDSPARTPVQVRFYYEGEETAVSFRFDHFARSFGSGLPLDPRPGVVAREFASDPTPPPGETTEWISLHLGCPYSQVVPFWADLLTAFSGVLPFRWTLWGARHARALGRLEFFAEPAPDRARLLDRLGEELTPLLAARRAVRLWSTPSLPGREPEPDAGGFPDLSALIES